MKRMDASNFHYDDRTIALHWTAAAIVLLTWCLGQSMDLFPRGLPRICARSLHITLGVVLLAIVWFRLWWRLTGGRRRPEQAKKLGQSLASAGHALLYALLLTGMLLGLANAWVRGDTIFQIFTIPKFDPGNKELQERVENLHALGTNILVIAAALHAALALFHHRVLRDDILHRMLRDR